MKWSGRPTQWLQVAQECDPQEAQPWPVRDMARVSPPEPLEIAANTDMPRRGFWPPHLGQAIATSAWLMLRRVSNFVLQSGQVYS
jgi:hypothetical protein